jgi:hypothetical protein
MTLFAPETPQARRAPRGPGPVVVQAMGARAPAATEAMRARMRDQVARNLRVLTEARLLSSPAGYVVDGSIDAFVVVDRTDNVEITCAVRLILSGRRSGAMVAMTSGQASYSDPDPRRPLKPALRERLETEVLDDAVRAASEELVQHFESRRKS